MRWQIYSVEGFLGFDQGLGASCNFRGGRSIRVLKSWSSGTPFFVVMLRVFKVYIGTVCEVSSVGVLVLAKSDKLYFEILVLIFCLSWTFCKTIENPSLATENLHKSL